MADEEENPEEQQIKKEPPKPITKKIFLINNYMKNILNILFSII